MPSTPRDDEHERVTYSALDLEAMAAAGDVELAMPGTPEADRADRAAREQLAAYNADLVAREGPDALLSDRQLRQAALAAEQDPRLVAHAFASYRERLGLDPAGLAAWLHVGTGQLAALALEPRPDTSGVAFVDEVRELAARYGADLGRLAEALG